MFNFPLKTDETPHGLVTEWELFEAIGAIFTFLFFNGDEGSGLKLKNGTLQAYQQLSELVKLNVTAIKDLGDLDKAIDDLTEPNGFLKLYGNNLIRRMLAEGYSIDSVVVQILLTSTGMINLSPQVPNSLPCSSLLCILVSRINIRLVCANHRLVFAARVCG